MDGLLHSPGCIHGQHVRIKAMEQAPCSLHIKCSIAVEDAWAGVFNSIHIRITTCDSNGTDAWHQRVDPVSLLFARYQHMSYWVCLQGKQLIIPSIVAFNVKHQEEVMLIPYELIIMDDDPMQAEECSHDGLKCNYFCHTCKVSSMHAEKNTDKGYTGIFQVLLKTSHLHNRLTTFVQYGKLHPPKDTHAQIKHQIQLSMLSGETKKVRYQEMYIKIRNTRFPPLLLTEHVTIEKELSWRNFLPSSNFCLPNFFVNISVNCWSVGTSRVWFLWTPQIHECSGWSCEYILYNLLKWHLKLLESCNSWWQLWNSGVTSSQMELGFSVCAAPLLFIWCPGFWRAEIMTKRRLEQE